MRHTVKVRGSTTPIGIGCIVAGLLFVLAAGHSPPLWVVLAGYALIAVGIFVLIRKVWQ